MVLTLSASRGRGVRLCRTVVPIIILILGMGMLASVRLAAAHGGEETLQLDQVRVGPYRLSAWSYPSLLSVGRVALSVAVREAQSGAPAQNCKVLVQLTPLEADGAPFQSLPSSRPTLRHPLYDFEVDLISPGPYRVDVQVQDASGWSGETSFDITVYPELGWLKWLIIALLGQAGLVGIWLAKDAAKVWGGRRWAVLEET